VATRLRAIMETPRRHSPAAPQAPAERVVSVTSVGAALSEQQMQAVRALLVPSGKVMVLTAVPARARRRRYARSSRCAKSAACAMRWLRRPGAAAKRLSEATGRPAKTIHRLLEFFAPGGFKRNAENPLAD